MTMKMTQRHKDMLDGKLGETKKFCMEKLVDFGEAVESTEMVDLSLVLNACRSGRRIAATRRPRKSSRNTTSATARFTIRSSR